MPGSRVSFFCDEEAGVIREGERALRAFVKTGESETFVLRSFFDGYGCSPTYISEVTTPEKENDFTEKCFLTALKIILLSAHAVNEILLSWHIENEQSRKKITNHFCEKKIELKNQLLRCQKFKAWFCASLSQINQQLLAKLNCVFEEFSGIRREIQLLFEEFSGNIKNAVVIKNAVDDDFVIIHSSQTFYGWLANLDHDVSPTRERSDSHTSSRASNATDELLSDSDDDDALMKQISSSRFIST